MSNKFNKLFQQILNKEIRLSKIDNFKKSVLLNIFNNLIQYYKTNYINNTILMKKYNYNDLYLDNLEKEGLLKCRSIDI